MSVPNFCDAGAKPIRGVKPIYCEKFVIGEVVTVKADDEDWGTVVKAIDYARGKIIVAEISGEERAVWGGLASLNAKIFGVKGVVIYGYVRDVEDIIRLKFPVFAKGILPNAGKPIGRGKINEPIKLDDIEIKPGDYIVMDKNGVAYIKREELENIKKRVKKIKEKEKNIREKILRGKSLAEILNL
ncbi:RraA family protein [Methanocaldococcus infernus]